MTPHLHLHRCSTSSRDHGNGVSVNSSDNPMCSPMLLLSLQNRYSANLLSGSSTRRILTICRHRLSLITLISNSQSSMRESYSSVRRIMSSRSGIRTKSIRMRMTCRSLPERPGKRKRKWVQPQVARRRRARTSDCPAAGQYRHWPPGKRWDPVSAYNHYTSHRRDAH